MVSFRTFICFISLICLSLSLSAKGFDGDAEKEKASIQIDRFPYMVAIRNFDRYDCSGVMVGQKTALTAAQCIDSRYDRSDKPEVWIGAERVDIRGNDTIVRQVVETRIHPNYTGNIFDGYDLALLMLNETTDIIPIRRPPLHEIIKFDHEFDFLSYGRATQGGAYSTVLSVSHVEVIANEACLKEEGIVFDEEHSFCVKGSIPCTGDEGGPVFKSNEVPSADILVAIVSATGCQDTVNIAALFNILTEELSEWIEDAIAEFEPPLSPEDDPCSPTSLLEDQGSSVSFDEFLEHLVDLGCL